MILQRRIDRRAGMRRWRERALLLLLLLWNLLSHRWRRRHRLSQGGAKGVHVLEQHVDLVLQRGHVGGHVLVLGRVLEAIAAVGRVDALEVQVAAALAGRLAIALDLAPLALVARQRDVSRAARFTAGRAALGGIIGVGLALGTVRVVWAVVVVLRVGMLWLVVLLWVELLLLLLLLLVLLMLAKLAVGMRGDLGQAMRRIHGCRPCALSP